MNIELNGAVRKPAPQIKNNDDAAVVAQFQGVTDPGHLVVSASALNPAKSVIPASRHARLGQDASEITEWRDRWHRENPGKTPHKCALAYTNALRALRPKKDDDPEGFRGWYDRLSTAQSDVFDETKNPKRDQRNKDRAAGILATEGRTVKLRGRKPTPELKKEQSREGYARFTGKMTDDERRAYERDKSRNRCRARKRLAAQPAPVAAPLTAATPVPAPVATPTVATPASVATSAPVPTIAAPTIAFVWPEAARQAAIRNFKLLEKERAATPAPAFMPVATPASVATSAPQAVNVALLVAQADLVDDDDGDDQTDLTDELAELDEALAAAAA